MGIYDYSEPEGVDPFETFLEAAQALWPSCTRLTADSLKPVWYKHFQRASWTALRDAMKRERGDHPDAVCPSWQCIIVEVKPARTESGPHGRNDYRTLLRNIKEAAVKQRWWEGAQCWDDARTWEHALAVATFATTHNTLTGQLRDDPEGRRAMLAKDERHNMTHYWHQYHADNGLVVPPELQEIPSAAPAPAGISAPSKRVRDEPNLF